jgi:hypothetical protein
MPIHSIDDLGLRIPGFNAALPPGASYGYHPGGWGKPPMDDQGRPLFPEAVASGGEEPIRYSDYQHWGALQTEEPSEEEVQQPAERYAVGWFILFACSYVLCLCFGFGLVLVSVLDLVLGLILVFGFGLVVLWFMLRLWFWF